MFYSPPKHDLKLQIDEEELALKEEAEQPWPDTSSLFSEDVEYQSLKDDINQCIQIQGERVIDFSTVSSLTCVVVVVVIFNMHV